MNTLTQPVHFDNPAAQSINVSYVAFVPEGQSTEARKRHDTSWQRAARRGWRMHTFPGDHVVYRVKPVAVAELLVATVADQNTIPPAP